MVKHLEIESGSKIVLRLSLMFLPWGIGLTPSPGQIDRSPLSRDLLIHRGLVHQSSTGFATILIAGNVYKVFKFKSML